MQLTEINIYPIKSTRRIALQESEVLARGLPWDRRWMLIDANNSFVTARQQPRLSMVETQIGEDTLTISGPGMPGTSISLQPSDTRQVEVGIWKDHCHAMLVSEQSDQWFSEYLGLPVRLVQMTDNIIRPVNPDYARAGDHVSFADGFPMLLISEASLDDLNSRLDTAVSMCRFRPNLVVAGCEAFAEDQWQGIRIGGVDFEGVKACSRCVFTTIDPDTGVKDPQLEPLRTLGTYRRRPEGGVYFGQNVIPRGYGTIHLGDTLLPLE